MARNDPRWNFAKLDVEKFCMALEWSKGEGPSEKESAEAQAGWIGRKMRKACDLATPIGAD